MPGCSVQTVTHTHTEYRPPSRLQCNTRRARAQESNFDFQLFRTAPYIENATCTATSNFLLHSTMCCDGMPVRTTHVRMSTDVYLLLIQTPWPLQDHKHCVRVRTYRAAHTMPLVVICPTPRPPQSRVLPGTLLIVVLNVTQI